MGLPFSWTGEGGLFLSSDLTPDQRASIEAVFAAHDPAEELFEETKRDRLRAVDAHLNAEAAALGYDSIVTAVTYAASSHPQYGPEGRAFLAWRDAVYDKCYELLAEVQAGTRPVPTSEELIALLPVLVISYT